MQIEIDLLKIERGLREGRVKVTRGGKTFWRKQRLGTKESEKPKMPVEYEDVPGIKGSVPTYKSLPSTFILDDKVVTQMGSFRKESKKSRREVGCGINVFGGKMSLGKMEKGGTSSMIIRGKTKYGSYHTHPNLYSDTFSLDDVLVLVSEQPTNLVMAHQVVSNNLWVAISSAETHKMMNEMGTSELIKLKKRYRLLASMATQGNEKQYRNFVKQFCDKYKIGLYVGKSNSTLKKYDGSW